MKRILYTNVGGETINIFERPPFILQKIEGFGSVQNEISYDGSYGMDGATKISDRLAVRDMLIEGTIVADNNEQLMEYRQELAKIFNPKISGTLNYKEYEKEYVIDIEVEHAPNFDMENTKRSQKFQLMLKALDPYWTDKSEIDAKIPMAREENLFQFPLEITDNFEFSRLIAGDVIEIQNNGDVAVGAVFTINVNGILVNPRLYNVITQEYFALNGTFTTGTRLRISTVRGKKRVEQDDGDGWYNIMTKRKVESTFLQIDRGINYLQLQADSGVEFTTSYIRFEPKILGGVMVELEVFKKLNEKDYDQLAVIDQFKSLVVNRRYYSANDFELKLALSMDNLDYLKAGNAVRINDAFYYINFSQVPDLESGELVVKGVSFFGLLNNRIVWENYSRQARPEVIARDLLNRHVVNPTNTGRKLHQLSLAPEVDLNTPSVRYQNSYGIVREQVEKLCETHDFGFRELMADPYVPSARIEFYKGKDLSTSVEFTTDAENVISESYEQSDFDERNVALVAGEGEGTERELVTLGSGSGLNRKELYVDARDLQSENDDVVMTTAEYQQALTERGNEKLAEHQPILILDGDINVHNQLYEYGVDYDLGDIVRRSSPTFKLAYNAKITEIQEIYENGLHIIPTFGKRSPTLIDMIKRK